MKIPGPGWVPVLPQWITITMAAGLIFFVVGDGGLPNALYHNNGDGTFTDIADEAGVADTPNGRGCVWFDYNNDGLARSLCNL